MTLVQGATPVGSSSAVTSLASNALPAAPTQNNLIVLAISIKQGGVSGFTPPTGFTILSGNQDASGTFAAIVGKVATGGETGAFTFSWTGSGFTTIDGPYEISGLSTDIAAIVESAITTWAVGNSNTPAVAASTPTTDANEFLIAVFARVSKNAMTAGPTGGFTLDDDNVLAGGTATTSTGLSFTHKELTANETPSVSVTLGNTRQWNAGLIALKVASSNNKFGTATISGGGTLTVVGMKKFSAPTSISGGGTITAGVAKVGLGHPSISGGGTITATGTHPAANVTGTATIHGGGTLTVTWRKKTQGAAVLRGGGVIGVTGAVVGSAPPTEDTNEASLWYRRKLRTGQRGLPTEVEV